MRFGEIKHVKLCVHNYNECVIEHLLEIILPLSFVSWSSTQAPGAAALNTSPNATTSSLAWLEKPFNICVLSWTRLGYPWSLTGPWLGNVAMGSR